MSVASCLTVACSLSDTSTELCLLSQFEESIEDVSSAPRMIGGRAQLPLWTRLNYAARHCTIHQHSGEVVVTCSIMATTNAVAVAMNGAQLASRAPRAATTSQGTAPCVGVAFLWGNSFLAQAIHTRLRAVKRGVVLEEAALQVQPHAL